MLTEERYVDDNSGNRSSRLLRQRPRAREFSVLDLGRPAPVLVLHPDRVEALARRTPRRLFKRGFDIAVSGVVLVLALPVMVIVALAIKLESPGPVLYRAERVARGGRRMLMLKFRKMRRDASGGLGLTVRDDERLTRVGAVLARTKLDELPQFINVLRGDMSLVGPRPEDPRFVAARRTDYAEILKVRPGITGLSQLAFAEESRILAEDDPVAHYLERIFPQKCALDRLYVGGGDMLTDVRILVWTVVVTLLRRPVAVHRDTGKMARVRDTGRV